MVSGAATLFIVLLAGALVLGVLAVVLLQAGRRRSERRRLFELASRDVDWLLDDAVGPAAVADREAHTRDVRQRGDRIHDTLSALAAAGGPELAAVAVELRTQANDLARTIVAKLGDPTADHRDLDVQLAEKRERTRHAKDALGERLR
jgi:hypothetical protein